MNTDNDAMFSIMQVAGEPETRVGFYLKSWRRRIGDRVKYRLTVNGETPWVGTATFLASSVTVSRLSDKSVATFIEEIVASDAFVVEIEGESDVWEFSLAGSKVAILRMIDCMKAVGTGSGKPAASKGRRM
jgi:hypothetical protein